MFRCISKPRTITTTIYAVPTQLPKWIFKIWDFMTACNTHTCGFNLCLQLLNLIWSHLHTTKLGIAKERFNVGSNHHYRYSCSCLMDTESLRKKQCQGHKWHLNQRSKDFLQYNVCQGISTNSTRRYNEIQLRTERSGSMAYSLPNRHKGNWTTSNFWKNFFIQNFIDKKSEWD